MGDIEKTASEKEATSKRLSGGGAKKTTRKGVSRKMIGMKAKRIFDREIADASKRNKTFAASAT